MVDSQGITVDARLDATGLNCPLPLLKAKMELARLTPGQVLEVTATDGGSQRDFRAFARLSGHALLREDSDAGLYRYWLKKAESV
ncbi:sulfurtransferase TusA family protein [Pseudomonas matsuisoli]|uniref:Transcriptional regulator n=1 Tax=Pseudomonas matsuisoli TaxID=1515666 RepID=A0A917PJF9_9PSED|nr:sulfurtransferase TusA family protein [Pseudomonas matsuisoli]GGJ80995.1 transcriptional regulator [Pseudomonas matsuisoli]